MSELEDLKAELVEDIKAALANPVKLTSEQADQAEAAVFDWVKPFVGSSLERMVKEGVLEREVIGGKEYSLLDGLNVEAVVYGAAAAGGCNLNSHKVIPGPFERYFEMVETEGRKRRANFKPHLRRRLKQLWKK